MPLKLVSGPANAEKAREVLDAFVGAIDRDPILVVPTGADVVVYRRELAERGVVFGGEVLTWSWLTRELARRAGLHPGPIGKLTQERVAAAAIAQTKLRVLGESAGTPGFATALTAFCEELEETRIDAARWYAALRAWVALEPARSDYAEDLADLYGAYRRGLQRIDRLDKPLHASAALDALRLDPVRWGHTPVFLYGFDDLTALQLDAIETLAGRCQTDVTVSLPHEAGRVAFAGRAELHQELVAFGAEVVELPARDDHYKASSVAVLSHIERNVFEDARAGDAPPPEVDDELLLLRGGGERAEFELVGANVARLIASGVPPEEIAVVLRSPELHASLIEDVLGALGIPYAVHRRVPAGRTALGRGILGLLRSALLDGSADDLLAWLRTPGHVHEAWKVDALEAAARRTGARTAAQARELWEQRDWKLDAIDRLARAQRDGPAVLYERLATETERLMRAPHRAEAAVLSPAEAIEVAAAGQLRIALRELSSLASANPRLLPDAAGLERMLGGIEVFSGETGGGRVTVASPLDVRARRVRALFACSLQERSFPRPGRPEPFLGDNERRAINAAGGVRLRAHEDQLGAERYLFYATVSRPTELLSLSWHDADDDGAPLVRSLFVDDVLDLFGPELSQRIQRRELGAVGFDAAPTVREAARAQAAGESDGEGDAIGPLTDAELLRSFAERETWSASSLEAWFACPVKWFVERLLHPNALIPDPEPMVRGEMAHKVLEEAIGVLSGNNAGPLRPEHLPEARRLALDAIERHQAAYRISTDPQRLMAALQRLRADVLNYLEFAAGSNSTFAPAGLELRFGGREDELPAVEIAEGLRLQGRIDRIDLSPDGRQAVVYDYKGAAGYPVDRWAKDGRLQLALYMLALPALMDAEPVGGLYQPLRNNQDPRPRGVLRKDADPGLKAVSTDRVTPEDLAEVLETARELAVRTLSELLAGEMMPRPATCGWSGGGCSYPSICRCES